MKVFISWSKSLSQECAEILRGWIKCTLQASQPWMSSEDLDKGTIWFNQISTELSDTSIGIICLTKENKNNPWILFESGALAKGLEEQRVYTLLIDLKTKDIEPPLSQFNHTTPAKADMKKLLVSINKQLGDKRLEDNILDQVFEMYWPNLDKDLKNAIKNHPVGATEERVARSPDDILSEILNTTRNLDKRMRYVESNRENVASALQDNFGKNFSSFELIDEIGNLVSKGFSLEDITNKLMGLAPREELLRMASQLIIKRDKGNLIKQGRVRRIDGNNNNIIE
jgi:hypothetical protein